MDLLEAVEKQEQQLIALKQLLEQELHLISSREPETLTALLQDKEEALGSVEALDNKISELYEAANAEQLDSPALELAFASCRKMVDDCQYLTQISAKSVEQGQLRLTHLRNLMMELRARENITYDKTGKTRGDGASKGFSA